METIKSADFFELRTNILKSSILIQLLITQFHPHTPFTIGETNIEIEPDTKTIITQTEKNTKVTKKINYSIIVMFVPYNTIRVGIQYKEHPIIWKKDYNLCNDLETIRDKIYVDFSIISSSIDYVFSEKNTPKDFIIYLNQKGEITLWRYGYRRVTETCKKTDLIVNFSTFEAYKSALQTTLKKYQLFEKILSKLVYVGHYSCSNTWENFRIYLSENRNYANLEYSNYENNTRITQDFDIGEFIPSNINKLHIPFMRLMLLS